MTAQLQVARQAAELAARAAAAPAAQVARYGDRALAAASAELGGRILANASAELAQAAIERWINLLYDRDTDLDLWYNLRPDGLIKVAPPWSRSRRTSYGLTEPQARLLLRIVRATADPIPPGRRLYLYQPASQRYILNRPIYPDLDLAIAYQRGPGRITGPLWQSFADRYPGGR